MKTPVIVVTRMELFDGRVFFKVKEIRQSMSAYHNRLMERNALLGMESPYAVLRGRVKAVESHTLEHAKEKWANTQWPVGVLTIAF